MILDKVRRVRESLFLAGQKTPTGIAKPKLRWNITARRSNNQKRLDFTCED
jgi:hypothetical protein